VVSTVFLCLNLPSYVIRVHVYVQVRNMDWTARSRGPVARGCTVQVQPRTVCTLLHVAVPYRSRLGLCVYSCTWLYRTGPA
jgi:hypothetical protein